MPETAPPTTPQASSTGAPTDGSTASTLALSAREAQVIGLIVQGLSNDEIAATVFLSINSVKTYIRTAYRKIGVTRRAQAVVWGMTHGFAPDQGNGSRPD
ncbi:helix-turn-helix transcriptional regulator [Nocardioides sp.]|uniref:response regulator transcription factor n=1 Tax=Nocardioides sp. TaxID=35761 RepID=UPI00286C6E05|nr:helix-turn-helix transcriptional regulator [Nocardioides sp.]